MSQSKTLIIAEAGIAHVGRLDYALKLVQMAADAKCDAIKFQAFSPTVLSGINYEKRAMLKGLALTHEELKILVAEARYKKLEFLCTPMDVEWLEYCVEELGMTRIKIGSAQVADENFVRAAAKWALPVMISNGMADNKQFCRAVEILTDYECEVTPMSCVSKYPTPDVAISMGDLARLKDLFGERVGFSSHCPSIWPTVAAVYAGASVTENHITLDDVQHPDYASSLRSEQLAALVREIRYAETRRSAA